MLTSLFVKNFALMDEMEVVFGPGLNIITGETGAGKSILIDALGATLGEKVDGNVLRAGTDKAIAEGVFDIRNLATIKEALKTNDLDEVDERIILRKEVAQSGRNRAFVNDVPVTVETLTAFGDLLVDLHGQHEHQALLKTKFHQHYLDEFGGYHQLLSQLNDAYQAMITTIKELENLKQKQNSLTEKKDLFHFQMNEIQAINPQLGEEDELIHQEKLLSNSEKLFQITSELYQNLYEREQSVLEIITNAQEKLLDLSQIDEEFRGYQNECQSARVIIEEISKFLQHYSAKIEFDPERLEQTRERLAQFSRLKKKYGGSIEEVIQHRQKIEQEFNLIENLNERIASMQSHIEQQRQLLKRLSVELTNQRQQAAQKLETKVVEVLNYLGMVSATFKVQIDQIEDPEGQISIDNKNYKITQKGMDVVEFLLSTNPGEGLKPLVKVASGGEVSRIMLALKSALAEVDKIPVLIFDEIDIGISGRIAQAVGKRLKILSRKHQIICITHLPQIASMGDQHYVVEKYSNETSTRTSIRKIAEEDRAKEIAKLLGGEMITEAHIQGAQQLIDQANINDI
jgi:DNA repair protein RecN (Recombination protein N)